MTSVDARPHDVRVVIVDDHPTLLDGTQASLQRAAGIVVVGTAGTADDALRVVDETQPDVLLLDIRLPDRSGIEVARQVRRTLPHVAIVVLSGYEDAHYRPELVKLRVRGYLSKSATGDEIVAAVRAAASGHETYAPKRAGSSSDAGDVVLSDRELEVLRLLVSGAGNQDIARTMHLAKRTVEFHVSNIMHKLGVESRLAAVARARQEGLI